MSEAMTPENGALTAEQAEALLLAPETQAEIETEAPEAPEEAAAEPQETEGEDQTPEDAEAQPEEQAEGEEAEAESEPVVAAEPPKYWSKDAKDAFAKLPPDLQAVVLAQEGPREEAAARAKAEATKQAQEAQAELTKVQTLAAALNERLPQWLQTFQSRWGATPPDWVAFAQANGTEAMTLAKAQYDAEREQIVQAAQETQRAQLIAHEQFLRTEFATLAEIQPELAPDAKDPRKGAEVRREVTGWLAEQGIPKEALAQISATEMSLAYDAMRWRKAQAELKAAPKSKPAAPAPRAPVRPASGQAQSPSQRKAQGVQNAFNAKPSIENATALLLNSK